MNRMIRPLALLLGAATLAAAQQTEIGGRFGFGRAEKHHWNSANYVVAGAEACIACGGSKGLFFEYHHWSRRGAGSGIYPAWSFDLGGAGVRFQGRNPHIRPSFDVGFVVGNKKRDSPVLSVPKQSVGEVGGGVGFGVALSPSGGWYVKPLVKVYLLSTNEVVVFAGASAGLRF